MDVIPGWPGADVHPPQPMIAQIRAVSETYRDNGGSVRFEMMEGAGHGPHFDHFEDWSQIFFDFLADNT